MATNTGIGVNTAKGGGVSWSSSWTQQKILDTFGEKILLWTTKENETAGYYTDIIGTQDRQSITDGGITGVLHPGRAISYDGSKSQYSRTIGNMPENFKIGTNSLTFFCRIKMDAAPAGSSLVYGDLVAGNGSFVIIIGTDGKLGCTIRDSAGAIVKYSSASICDGVWHDIFILINKAGNYGLYVDNILNGVFTDISAKSFAVIGAAVCSVGGSTSYHSGVKYLRDIRLFNSAITSETDRDTIHAGGYVAGCVAWWFMEEGKESNVYRVKDSVGTTHLNNFAFDATSLVSGAWPSLYNKFGYSPVPYTSGDLILGDGVFDDATEWTFTASRFEVTGGVAYFKAVDTNGPRMLNKRVISIAAGDIVKCTFTITEGATAQLGFVNQAAASMMADAVFGNGTHTVVFQSLIAATGIAIYGIFAGGSFKIDNWTVEIYEAAIISPKMNAAIPTTDVWNRALTFKDHAKYNLQKVDEDTVNLPDYVGEVFDACELITVDDWYDAAGLGNEIDLVDIEPYQTKRQYYNNEELIIIKSTATLTDAEDEILKKKLKLGSETYTPIYNVPRALGALTGTTAQIYATPQAIIDAALIDPVASTIIAFTHTPADLNPAKKHITGSWADVFSEDLDYILPLLVKYDFAHTFMHPIYPHQDDYRNSTFENITKKKLSQIENSGSWDAPLHGLYTHIAYFSNSPLFDGRTTPSNDDLRVDRGDGNNELGHPINEVISVSVSVGVSWMGLTEALVAKTWANLSDADCIAWRKSLSAFGRPLGTSNEKVLEGMDYLSNLYCGTTGYSVYNGDYTYSNRIPNTVGGVEPDDTHRIQGGIFQGAATTFNHEIWERLLIINGKFEESLGVKRTDVNFTSSAGGGDKNLFYNTNPVQDYGRYLDKLHTKVACAASVHTSSITGVSRSFIDCQINYGIIGSSHAYGDGYANYNMDGLTRLEAQRIHKKNGLKKLNNVGDGYVNMSREWDATIPVADQNTLLATADVVKELYDYTFTNTDGRYTAGTNESMPPPFDKLLNALIKYIAWGVTPDIGDDSGCQTKDEQSSFVLVLEALFQFCKRAGIEVISREEAVIMGMTKTLPIGYNYFPNYLLDTTVKTITDAVNAITYPDGWNGGVVISEDTGSGAVNVLHIASDGTIFTRQYAIKPATFNLSFKAKGVGTLKIRKILNKDTFNTTSGMAFTEINSIAINSSGGYTEYTDTVVIPDAAMEVYAAPATPAEEAYQNYMKGYGDKICGIQIELVIAGGNYVKMGNCSLIE